MPYRARDNTVAERNARGADAPEGEVRSTPAPRCAVLRAALVALPVPLALLALPVSGGGLSLVNVAAVVIAALTAAKLSRWCAERRFRRDVQLHARELAHTKRQILALVSHELRTPVTGVVGFSRTLSGRLDDLDHDTLRLFVDAIDEHSNRLSRLIDNVVIASRTPLMAGGGTCQLSRALSEAVARVGLRHRDDRVRISLDGPLEAGIDEEAAVRVLTNLLDNALKFGDPDEPIIVEGAQAPDGKVSVQVGNAGPAIPLGLRAALYEPFVQGDPTDTRTADGLGLGLHVVRQLVEAHGGTIDLVDHPRLTVFKVTLPGAATGHDLQRTVAAARRRAAAAPPVSRSGEELQDRGRDRVGVLQGHPVRGGRDHLHA